MGEEFTVEPAVLEQFAKTSLERRDSFDELHAAMARTHVPADSFGHIPGIGSRVYATYDQFVSGCADGIASAAEAMASVAAAVRGVVTEYATSDRSAADSMTIVRDGLGQVDIRGVR
jgi:hypothetical protein